jgi:hypothetical protein
MELLKINEIAQAAGIPTDYVDPVWLLQSQNRYADQRETEE